MPYLILGIAAFLLILAAIISYATYKLVFGKGKCVTNPYEGIGEDSPHAYAPMMRERVKKLLNTPYETVEITSNDGLLLRGRLYSGGDGSPVEILMHGYRSLSTRDFSGGACEAIERGHNVLLVDQRAHGESDGRTISFGALEADDCLSWIKYAEERFGNVKIILIGISMGAATVLLAAAKGLPDSVKGVIADCPYSSATDIIMKVGREKRYPMRPLLPFLRLGARLFGGFSLSDAEPVKFIKSTRVPILLIHGEDDSFVPCDMSRAIKEKRDDIFFHTFPGAGHGTSYCVDPERYREIANNFLGDVLK